MIIFYFLVWFLPMSSHPLWGSKWGALTGFEYMGIVCLIYAICHILFRGDMGSVFRTWAARSFISLYFVAFFSVLLRGNGLGLGKSRTE